MNTRKRFSMMSGMLMAVALLLLPVASYAAPNLGEIGQNMGNNVLGLAFFLKMLAYLVGLGLLVGAIIMFAMRHKSQTPMSHILGMAMAGILLLSITALASSMSSSVYGSDQTSNSMSQLGN